MSIEDADDEGGPVFGVAQFPRITSTTVAVWHDLYFGHRPELLRSALKVVEEVGEVAGAILKRDEGRVDTARGLVDYESWTDHLHAELGDALITLHILAYAEDRTADELMSRRFVDVAARARRVAGER